MQEPSPQFDSRPAALWALDWHGQRRRQQIPTLSVVVGAEAEAALLVRQWLAAARLAVCETAQVGLAALVGDWFACLAAGQDLPAAAFAWLAERTDHRGDELRRRLQHCERDERDLFLDRTLGAAATSPVEIACRTIIDYDCRRDSTNTALAKRLLTALDRDAGLLVAGVAALVGQDGLPGLFVNLPEAAPPSDVETAGKSLAALTSRLPQLNALLAVSPRQFSAYLSGAAESHSLALVREGAILLDDAEPRRAAASEDRLAAAAEPSAASENETWAPESADDDPARSRAERYLFERLQSHGETANLFELNGVLSDCGGFRGSMEIDLLARELRVAVEIDGYFHFQDLDAYRRDRRKDLLLQRAGYLVVRCLADDVVSRLEEIVHTIVAAVRLRRASRIEPEDLPP